MNRWLLIGLVGIVAVVLGIVVFLQLPREKTTTSLFEVNSCLTGEVVRLPGSISWTSNHTIEYKGNYELNNVSILINEHDAKHVSRRRRATFFLTLQRRNSQVQVTITRIGGQESYGFEP